MVDPRPYVRDIWTNNGVVYVTLCQVFRHNKLLQRVIERLAKKAHIVSLCQSIKRRKKLELF